jgi:hypothetical protein
MVLSSQLSRPRPRGSLAWAVAAITAQHLEEALTARLGLEWTPQEDGNGFEIKGIAPPRRQPPDHRPRGRRPDSTISHRHRAPPSSANSAVRAMLIMYVIGHETVTTPE